MRLDRWDVPSCAMFCNESNYEQVLTAGQGHENHLVAAFSSSESWPYSKGIHEDRSQEGECTVKSSHRSEQHTSMLWCCAVRYFWMLCGFSLLIQHPRVPEFILLQAKTAKEAYGGLARRALQDPSIPSLGNGDCAPHLSWSIQLLQQIGLYNCLIYSKLCRFHWPCLVPVWPLIPLWAVKCKHNYLLMETILSPLRTGPASGSDSHCFMFPFIGKGAVTPNH